MSGESSYKLYVIAVGRCTTRYNPDGFVVDPFGPRDIFRSDGTYARRRSRQSALYAISEAARERKKKRVRSIALFGAGGEDLTKRERRRARANFQFALSFFPLFNAIASPRSVSSNQIGRYANTSSTRTARSVGARGCANFGLAE